MSLARHRRVPLVPAPSHEYLFRNTLTDEKGGPALVNINGGALTYDRYSFVRDLVAMQGLRLDGAFAGGVGTQYTIAARCNLSAFPDGLGTDYWVKLLDFKNQTNDEGLYWHPSRTLGLYLGLGVDLEHNGASDAWSPDTTHDFVLTRKANTKLVCAYLDGVLTGSVIDAGDLATFSTAGNRINILLDDTTSPVPEVADGWLNYFAMWDNIALSPGQVANLHG